VPTNPKPAHLFAACAAGDADLVEALVLRCRVRVDARYDGSQAEWHKVASRRDCEPAEGTTALCYVVTWCDVLGEKPAERVARRLLLLRADPALDDGHPDVRFPPLCAAVANGSTRLALLLLHAGAEPDAETSDGRRPLHVLALAARDEDRATLLEALVHAGADVDAVAPSRGDAPLHVAAREGLLDVITGLITFGANTLLENNEGLTASEVALVELQADYDDIDLDRIDALQRCHALLA